MSKLQDIHARVTNFNYFRPDRDSVIRDHFITVRTYVPKTVGACTNDDPYKDQCVENENGKLERLYKGEPVEENTPVQEDVPVEKTFWLYLLHNYSVDKKVLEILRDFNEVGEPD